MKKIFIVLFVIETFLAFTYYEKIFKSAHSTNTSKQIKIVNKETTQQSVTPTIADVQPKNSLYKNGTYVGSVADAIYGNVQVQISISDGKIAKVTFLQYPHDQQTSLLINQQYDPILVQEAIQMQSYNVDIVSGATQTSQAFIQSMQTALEQAKFNG